MSYYILYMILDHSIKKKYKHSLFLSPKLQPNLEFLDASYNRLVTLEGLRGLGQLKELDVRWNKLTNAREDTAVLRKHTPALLKLDTRYNPWNRVCSMIKN